MALLLHVPHASNDIPSEDLVDFVVTSDTMAKEKLRLVDHYTDELYMMDNDKHDSADDGEKQKNAVVAKVCRLVVDMERFPDDAVEGASKVGMGATYIRTTQGEVLRQLTVERRQELMNKYYWPHHAELDDKATRILAEHGRCIVLDCHSFPVVALPTQTTFLDDGQPEICIGTDPVHTSPGLRDLVVHHFEKYYKNVLVDQPFAGTLVPNKFYGKEDVNLQSIMVELRRDLYMNESTGQKKADGFIRLQRVLKELRETLEQYSF